MPRLNTVLEKRYASTEETKRLLDQRKATAMFPHVAPFSLLVAGMGNYWAPGCFASAEEMCQRTWQTGIEVCLYEQPDLCYQPFDAIGVMRNMAYMKALREGWENILYLDNDVLVKPDTALNLMGHTVPIVSPIVTYADGEAHGLTMPLMEQGKGLALVTSCVLSCLLFNIRVFSPWSNGGFWQDALGADELYHFEKLYTATGHHPFVDTGEVVTCMNPPHYPLESVLEQRWVEHLKRVGQDSKREAEEEPARKTRPDLWTPNGLKEV